MKTVQILNRTPKARGRFRKEIPVCREVSWEVVTVIQARNDDGLTGTVTKVQREVCTRLTEENLSTAFKGSRVTPKFLVCVSRRRWIQKEKLI